MKNNNFIMFLVAFSLGFVVGSILVIRMDVNVYNHKIMEASVACQSKVAMEYFLDYSGRIHRVKCANGEYKDLL